jgi:hypothetical protein
MERRRLQAIEALGISGNSVKCQKYDLAVPIVGKLTGYLSDDINHVHFISRALTALNLYIHKMKATRIIYLVMNN